MFFKYSIIVKLKIHINKAIHNELNSMWRYLFLNVFIPWKLIHVFIVEKIIITVESIILCGFK